MTPWIGFNRIAIHRTICEIHWRSRRRPGWFCRWKCRFGRRRANHNDRVAPTRSEIRQPNRSAIRTPFFRLLLLTARVTPRFSRVPKSRSVLTFPFRGGFRKVARANDGHLWRRPLWRLSRGRPKGIFSHTHVKLPGVYLFIFSAHHFLYKYAGKRKKKKPGFIYLLALPARATDRLSRVTQSRKSFSVPPDFFPRPRFFPLFFFFTPSPFCSTAHRLSITKPPSQPCVCMCVYAAHTRTKFVRSFFLSSGLFPRPYLVRQPVSHPGALPGIFIPPPPPPHPDHSPGHLQRTGNVPNRRLRPGRGGRGGETTGPENVSVSRTHRTRTIPTKLPGSRGISLRRNALVDVV